ncbi:VanZ family protein [Mucilaginibacter sp. AW1-3]
MRYIFKYQGPTLFWALFIFILCNIKMGGVSHSPLFFAGFDKLVHCGLFFVLAALMSSGIVRANTRHNLTALQQFLSFLIPVVFGGIIELLQFYIFTWRSGEWDDLFADTVGAGMAMFCVILTMWSQKYEKQS